LPQTVGLSQAFKVFVHKANAAENIPDAHVLIVMYFSPNMGVQDVRFLSENQNHRPACGKKSLTLKIVKKHLFLAKSRHDGSHVEKQTRKQVF